MDKVEALRKIKKFQRPAECYHISFNSGAGKEIEVNASDIGSLAMDKLINAYVGTIDDLIEKKLKELEEI